MADLSNLLGAVYGEGATPSPDADGAPVPVEPSAAERAPAVPDGADDEHLDAAFAEWKPGASAGAVEHEAVAGTPGPAAPLADDLAATLSEALVAHKDEDHDTNDGDGQPHLTPQRVAAAELTATSRFGAEPEPVAAPAPVEEPAPEPETAGASLLASLPYATDERKQAPKVEKAEEPGDPVPVGPRTWERSDDDILPSKGGKGFFSLSLRRG